MDVFSTVCGMLLLAGAILVVVEKLIRHSRKTSRLPNQQSIDTFVGLIGVAATVATLAVSGAWGVTNILLGVVFVIAIPLAASVAAQKLFGIRSKAVYALIALLLVVTGWGTLISVV